MTQLRRCTGCSRHVFIHESACPFCQSELLAVPERPPLSAPTNLSRAQRLALAAAVAGQAVSACAETSVPTGIGPVAGQVAPAAGSGSAGSGANRGGTGSAGTGVIIPPYGLPPIGGTFATPVYGAPLAGNVGIPPNDAGLPVKDAAPPDQDAGVDDDAGPVRDGGPVIHPVYGAPIPSK